MAPATCEEINDAACEASKVATEETENSREGKASTSSGTSLTTSGELKMTPMENLKTATILVGMGLAIFLGALVSYFEQDPTHEKLIVSAGYEYRGDRHPGHYERLQLLERCRMVWLGIVSSYRQFACMLQMGEGC